MAVPRDAAIINTHEDLLQAFENIDQRLHRIAPGSDPPYIWNNKLYLPASMYAIPLAAIGAGGTRNVLGTSGQLPVTEDSAAEILIALIRGLEGFFGDMTADKNPGPFKINEKGATTDGSGNLAATEIVAAPGATIRYRCIAAWCKAASDSGGIINIVSGGINIATFATDKNGVNAGPLPVDFLCVANDNITFNATTIATTDGVVAGVCVRVEDA